MNIGIFTDTYFPQVSGVATSIRTLKEELEKLGHKVTISPQQTLVRQIMKKILFVYLVFLSFHLKIDGLQSEVLI